MPRIVKHRDIRRAEILDQAFTIFLKRGYDNTSLNDVIATAGLSKGMFYHHFPSKEALLVALFARVTEGMYEALRPVVEEEGVDPRTRLQNIMNRGAEFRLANVELTRSVFGALLRPESNMLYQGVVEAWSARMRPVVTAVIEDGIAQGVFDTFNAEGVADTMLLHAASTRDATWRGMAAKTIDAREAAIAELSNNLKLHALTMSRLLGLPDDAFRIGPPDFARRFIVALNPLDGKAKAATPKAMGPRKTASTGKRPSRKTTR
ncbi:TetR/AcrR family transcriptional regulator [Bradyrhizobium sp. SYSU BS000235]|uniref:TetR/AcrR family transcriptional regulator n=1 Tax=Bradyrhizobium sp. SYSU BS000235 TaxID=3411332 RepID=UPI003C78AB3B